MVNLSIACNKGGVKIPTCQEHIETKRLSSWSLPREATSYDTCDPDEDPTHGTLLWQFRGGEQDECSPLATSSRFEQERDIVELKEKHLTK